MLNEENIKSCWVFKTDERELTYSGILSFDPKSRIVLEVWGHYDSEDYSWITQENERYDLITGISFKGKKYTLVKLIRISYNESSTGMFKKKYLVDFFIIGYHFDCLDDMKFCKFSVDYQYLSEWISRSGLKIETDHNHDNSESSVYKKMSYSFPTESFYQTDDMKIDIRFHFVESNMNRRSTRTFTERKPLQIELSEVMGIKDFIRKVDYPLRKLFSFFIGEPIFHNTIYTYLKESNEEKIDIRRIQIKLVFSNYRAENTKYVLERPFSFSEIENSFPLIYENWLDMFNKFEPFVRIYFRVMYDSTNNWENDFLNYVQGLENYFVNSTLNHGYIEEYKFTELMKQIESCVEDGIEELGIENDSFKKRIINPIKYCNQPTLRKFLKLFWNKNKNILDATCGKRNECIEEIVMYRNYLTHYENNDTIDDLSYIRKISMTDKVKLFIQIVILTEMGFEENIIKEKVLRNSCFKLPEWQ